jgi:chromosome segregation protein
MRLEKIKLAGFKSFVDPTTVPFPSNLVGVVGPNGCGKSNVIDAVRWVMGESSAKMLRGESMADVIFNGSTSRKPVGTASIELLFDNSDGAAGGQYAQYGHISVRRQVTRDGQSNYFLNNVRCRRRDITDLFLGTGLGPRSYAIIEQGMISRIIESRPEELRVYLEEAAGISRYKERRRETENRIRHTRENLDRLNDLREEIQKQLRHLERQAATAERYKNLKQEERQVSGELLALRLQEMEQDLQARDRQIGELETKLEAGIAAQRRVESEIELKREAHHDANESFNEIQGRFYAVGSDIARLEEGIQYARESRQRNESELQRTEQSLEEARQHSSTDQDKLETMAQALLADEPKLDAANRIVEESSSRRQELEATMQSWQTEWDEFNARATEPAQTAQVERSLINQLEQQEGHLRRRLEKLEEERSRLSDLQLQAEISELESREQEQHAVSDELRSAMEASLSSINQLRTENNQRQQSLADARAELETLKGRLASLQALQQAALGDDDQDLHKWLDEAGLAQARRLLEYLEVEPGWQVAVENVLGHHLQSICVDDLAKLETSVGDFAAGNLNLFEMSQADVPEVQGTLAAVVQGPDQLRRMLSTVRTASSLREALAETKSLSAGESVVTAAGEWLGSGWLHLQKDQDASAGILAREQEVRELSRREDELRPLTEALAQALSGGQQVLVQSEQERDLHQASLEAANKRLADCQAQLSGKRARAEHMRQRVEALVQEREETSTQIEQGNQNMQSARNKLHRALEQMESLGVQREQLVARRKSLQDELQNARDAAQRASQQAHEIALRVESARSSRQSLLSGIERMHSQLQQFTSRCSELREIIQAGEEPLLLQQQDLEQKLEQRMAVEAELGEARRQLEAIDHRLRELETERHQSDQAALDAREKLNQAKLGRQEVLVRSKTVDEQLQQTGLQRVELRAQLPEDASITQWQEKSAQLANRIQRLGPINLAAIDEFREQSERAEYLEKQHEDVLSALETLEEAIHKIDRETRTRFKETFDKVNTGLKEMFPKLFGGGHAYLELVGDDPLNAGVAIMARPPGKRNASIHLLSGGEKALSAVAMVFSIFQLNPAPFCMLDEVDAPLDDANVSRFCALVKEMSASVQFIFITHNKLTMEIANQLTGVTMSEPGVSRLVSVDIEEAAQLAAM